MRNLKYLITVSFILGGCATPSGKIDANNDASLIQMPALEQKAATPDTAGFEDISFAGPKRLKVLTDKMEIEKQTDNYINNGQAQIITRPDGTILYPYGLAQVDITAKRMMYTKIILQEGEKIMSMASGDTVRWSVLSSYIGDASCYTPVVLIKPFMGGLLTSLSVITDKRDYDIIIRSVDTGDYMSRVGFYYPQDKADAIKIGLPPGKTEADESRHPKIDIEHIKYDYRIQGDRGLNWYPTGIFEDGNKVFIRMPEKVDRSQLPVFMTIDQAGRVEAANYRYLKPYFIVDSIFDKGVLLLGTEKYRQMIRLIKV